MVKHLTFKDQVTDYLRAHGYDFMTACWIFEHEIRPAVAAGATRFTGYGYAFGVRRDLKESR